MPSSSTKPIQTTANASAKTFHRDRATKILEIDGWQALKSSCRRKSAAASTLVDPPFEVEGEFDRMIEGLVEATRRFATGTLIFWYPVKDERAVARMKKKAALTAIPKLLNIELYVAAPSAEGGLSGTGLLILNPPYTLWSEAEIILPFLAKKLARGPGAPFRPRLADKPLIDEPCLRRHSLRTNASPRLSRAAEIPYYRRKSRAMRGNSC